MESETLAFAEALRLALDKGMSGAGYAHFVGVLVLPDGQRLIEAFPCTRETATPAVIERLDGKEAVSAAAVIADMAGRTWVEAGPNATREPAGHGRGVLRYDADRTTQLLITDPGWWSMEHVADVATGLKGFMFGVGVQQETHVDPPPLPVFGVLCPPEPYLGPLAADLRRTGLRQINKWPKGVRGGGATWAEVAWARLLRGDTVKSVLALALTEEQDTKGPWPWDIMPAGGAAGTYMYLMRRFGPPRLGFDSYKEMGCWYLSAGGDVIVSIYPRACGVGVGLVMPQVFLGQRENDPWWRPAPWIVGRVIAILADLLRPTNVRDVYFNPLGRVTGKATRRAVRYFDPFAKEERERDKAGKQFMLAYGLVRAFFGQAAVTAREPDGTLSAQQPNVKEHPAWATIFAAVGGWRAADAKAATLWAHAAGLVGTVYEKPPEVPACVVALREQVAVLRQAGGE